MALDSIMRLASMNKPITSAAVTMLVKKGHFDPDDPVGTTCPPGTGPATMNGTCMPR